MTPRALWTSTLLALAGCFYIEPINQRPSLDIERMGEGAVQRGSTLSLYAKQDDPEGHDLTYRWSALACSDAGCDPTAFDSGTDPTFALVVPRYLADNVTTVRRLEIELNAVDELGAAANPSQTETYEVVNGSPELTVERHSDYQFVVGTPVELYARYSDPDDDLELVSLAWTAFSPTQSTADLMDLGDVPPSGDPDVADVGKWFTPGVEGEWQVRVIARDEVGPPTEKLMAFEVGPDRAPCLAQWSPLAPTAPTAYLPLTEPTIFQVPVVDDELDRYPGNPAGPRPEQGVYLGQAAFQWSIKRPGANAFQSIGATHQVVIDPQQYRPGDRLEVRVEIFDRTATVVSCADDQQTCAADASRPSCIQRQTWRVEAR